LAVLPIMKKLSTTHALSQQNTPLPAVHSEE